MKAETIGQRIKRLREAMGLDLKSFCELSGLSPQCLKIYERDQAKPGAEKIITLIRAFGITADELLGVSGKKLRKCS